MTQKEKEQVAIFRFGVIFNLLDEKNRQWGDQKRTLDELTEKSWEVPSSGRTHLSRATILSWVKRYKERGERIEALFPSERSDCGRRRSFSDETAAELLQLREEFPRYTVKKLVEIALKRNIFSAQDSVKLSTVYRLFSLHKTRTLKKQEDLRKFEVELSNDLWQSDCLHGPRVLYNGKRVKSYLFVIIDDYSRLIVGSKFYLSESAESFLDCFWTALRTRGLPRILYCDNGSSFRSHRLQIGCASLQIALRYARPYRPVGKGKVERFNRTVRMQFLPDLPEDLSLEELNAKWEDYVQNDYHTRKHGSTGEPPLTRYTRHISLLRGAPDKLPDYFRAQEERTVAKDRSIRLEGKLYQAPVGFAGKRVTLRFEALDRVELFYDNVSYGFIYETDQRSNSRIGRLQPQAPSPSRQSGTLFTGVEQ